MKLTLMEPKYLRDSILIISELVNEVNLKFTQDKVELVAVDPATVAMVIFKLLSSAFSEYTLEKERIIGITLLFTEAIEDMDIISDNLTFSVNNQTFLIQSEGTTSSGNVEINADEETNIELQGGEGLTSRYSVEYLKKIIKASKLASNVTLEFGQDYPLRAEYKILDKLSLQFVLAPRIPND